MIQVNLFTKQIHRHRNKLMVTKGDRSGEGGIEKNLKKNTYICAYICVYIDIDIDRYIYLNI